MERQVVQGRDHDRGERKAKARLQQVQHHLVVGEEHVAVGQVLTELEIVQPFARQHHRVVLEPRRLVALDLAGPQARELQQLAIELVGDPQVQDRHRGGHQGVRAPHHAAAGERVAVNHDRTQRRGGQSPPQGLAHHVVLNHQRRGAVLPGIDPLAQDQGHGGRDAIDDVDAAARPGTGAIRRLAGLGAVVEDPVVDDLHSLPMEQVDPADRVQVVEPVVLDHVLPDHQVLHVGQGDAAVTHAVDHRRFDRRQAAAKTAPDLVLDDGQALDGDQLVHGLQAKEPDHADAVQAHVEDTVVADGDLSKRSGRDLPSATVVIAVPGIGNPGVSGPAGEARVVVVDQGADEAAGILAVLVDDHDAAQGDAVAVAALDQVLGDPDPLAGAGELDTA